MRKKVRNPPKVKRAESEHISEVWSKFEPQTPNSAFKKVKKLVRRRRRCRRSRSENLKEL